MATEIGWGLLRIPNAPRHMLAPSQIRETPDFYPVQLRKFFRQNLNTYSYDTAMEDAIVLILNQPHQWSLTGTFSRQFGGVEGWLLRPLGPPEEAKWTLYTGRTAVPSSYGWIAAQARPESQRSVGWINECISRVSRFSELGRNWDGYGGKPLDTATMLRAFDVAFQIAEIYSVADRPTLEPPFVAPLSSGGILFEIRNRARELHLTVEPGDPKHIGVLKSTTAPSGDEVEEEIDVLREKLTEVVSWVFEVR